MPFPIASNILNKCGAARLGFLQTLKNLCNFSFFYIILADFFYSGHRCLLTGAGCNKVVAVIRALCYNRVDSVESTAYSVYYTRYTDGFQCTLCLFDCQQSRVSSVQVYCIQCKAYKSLCILYNCTEQSV